MPRPNMTLRPMSGSQRQMRYPAHPFYVSHLPYAITPVHIAPVLPGETLKSMRFQVRAVTDPIQNPLIGWWLEYYFFYVKLSDLYEREELREMVLNPAWSPSDVTTAQGGTTQDITYYYSGGTGMIDYVKLCYRRVVDTYFRDEDETYLDQTVSDGTRTYSMAQLVGNNVLDSAMLTDDATATDVSLVDAATTDVLYASEVDAGMRLWNQQRLYGLTELSYEDWLASFGITPPQVELHKPELIRYIREWSYPTNTIDPTNGVARSAVSWTLQERADKPRFFSEPGFIFGVSVCRPKVYIRQQEGTFTSALNDWRTWLPAIFQPQDNHLSWKLLAHDRGPLASVVTDTDGYQVDIKDLFLYGEQFVNRTLTSTDQNYMDAVNATLTKVRYPLAASDIEELFVDAASGKKVIRQDGVVNHAIACAPVNPLLDTSPRGGVRSGETSGGGY